LGHIGGQVGTDHPSAVAVHEPTVGVVQVLQRGLVAVDKGVDHVVVGGRPGAIHERNVPARWGRREREGAHDTCPRLDALMRRFRPVLGGMRRTVAGPDKFRSDSPVRGVSDAPVVVV
jgi:hypothetical protein